MPDDLRHRYAELVTGWFEPGTRIARLSELLAVRDEAMRHLEVELGRVAALAAIHEYERDKQRERAETAEAAIARVRRLCDLTIDASCRVQAIDQARDTLAALNDSQEADRG